ncbi:MAG: dTDP-4-dehydrorhamnose reductase [Treponema sp.]|nr:dTDP-4-dehydrorhamnose reductase [Treponema sp.]
MIWLIGCKGMLGTEIARQLSENKIDFKGTDIDVDITNPDALDSFASSLTDLEYIINCSAYTAVDKAESDADFAKKLNEDGPANIARVAKKYGAIMIHISTDYVFDGSGNTPRTEDMPIAPIGVYGLTKANGEKALMKETDSFYILRTAWLYGWAGKNFVYTMIRAMNTHEAVKVVNDQKGSPTFASDLANVILKIIDKKTVPFGIYHCTDNGEITWWDFTNEIKKQGIEKGWITNKDCVVNPCSTDEYPTPAKRPAYSVLSKDKIQKALGITLPDWKESLSAFLSSSSFDKSRIE